MNRIHFLFHLLDCAFRTAFSDHGMDRDDMMMIHTIK